MTQWITARQAAARTATSIETICRAARRGRLRGVRLNGGRVWRFRIDDVDAWIRGAEGPELRDAVNGWGQQ